MPQTAVLPPASSDPVRCRPLAAFLQQGRTLSEPGLEIAGRANCAVLLDEPVIVGWHKFRFVVSCPAAEAAHAKSYLTAQSSRI
jgi:hypothetical protein